MKKSITKLLSVMLVLAMLVPMMGIMTSAESSEIENLWNVPKETSMRVQYTQSISDFEPGDIVTIGPISTNNTSTIIRLRYTVEGVSGYKLQQVFLKNCTIVDNITNGTYIVQYQIPDINSDRIVFPVNYMFRESTLITLNRPFDAEEYLDYMNNKGVDVSSLYLPNEYTGIFKNVFPKSNDDYAGRLTTATNLDGTKIVVRDTATVSTNNYNTSPSIEVKEGDMVCFAGNVYQIWFFDSEDDYISMYSSYTLDYCRKKCRIYALEVPMGATSMRVTVSRTAYTNGNFAVTVNQPMISYEDYQLCLGNFDIAGVNITVNTANEDLVYSGTPKTPKVTLTDTSALGIDFKEGVDYTLSYENNVNAGTATVTANFIGNFTGSVSQTFTIAPRPIVLVWGEDEMMYSGASFTPSAKAFGLLNGDVCDVIVSGSGVTVGTYTAEAVALSNSNYAIPENATCEFTITFNPYLFAYEAGCIIYDAASDRIVDAVSDLAEDAAQVVTNELEKASDKAEAVVAEKIEELAVEAEKAASELATEVEETVENAYAQVDDFFSNLMNIFGW